VSNGTAALHLSFLALGCGFSDEIIQPTLNFVATANMTVAVGATPVVADIVNLNEPTVSPIDIEHRITARTKAIVVMHYGGYPCRMAEICSICERHGLALVEDACHAIGAYYLDPQQRPPHGNMVGNLMSSMACFSFFGNKNLVTGEGGMVVTNSDELAEKLRHLRSHGMTTLTWDRYQGHASSYDVITHGYNYRLDEIRASLGRVQLRRLKHNNYLRQQIVMAYRHYLSDLPGWIIPFDEHSGDSAYHLMVILAPNEKVRREKVQVLKDAGVQTSLHYPSLTSFSAFDRFLLDRVETSETFAKRAITLPLYPAMTVSQVEEICSLLQKQS
jgi:dTDP-4-amino-4,6-dideoxygalactose transaminase